MPVIKRGAGQGLYRAVSLGLGLPGNPSSNLQIQEKEK